MKRVGYLYGQIADPDNLRLAFTKALRGKRDREEVRNFIERLDENLARLRHELLTENVVIGPYHFFQVFDPKERLICAASFRERVLHHAMMNLCEPVLERYSIENSFACRKGKGGQKALKKAQDYCGRYAWYLKLDIRRYFDSIDHAVLLARLGRLFKDRALMRLFERLLASYATAPGKGLPIGNLVSQHLANFFLGRLDHWLKQEKKVPGYLRYMDDFVLFADDKAILLQWLEELEDFLHREMHLALHPRRQLNRSDNGLPFLGMRVFAHHIRLAPRSRRRFIEKLKEYEWMAKSGTLSEWALAQRVTALVAFTRQADADGFRRKVLFAS
jgi:retron-type reverse transcriptase